jgi:hypothetical protein
MTYVFQKKNYAFNNHELIFLQGKQLVSFPLGKPWSTADIHLRLDFIRNHFYKGTTSGSVKKKFIKNIMIVDSHGGNTTILLFYGDTEKEEGSTNSIKLSLPTEQKLWDWKEQAKYDTKKTVLSMFEDERDKLSRGERILYGQRAAKVQTTENALRF